MFPSRHKTGSTMKNNLSFADYAMKTSVGIFVLLGYMSLVIFILLKSVSDPFNQHPDIRTAINDGLIGLTVLIVGIIIWRKILNFIFDNPNRTRNTFWFSILAISSVISFVLLTPFMKIHLGWNVPLIEVGHGDWKYLWWTIPADKQIGFMLLTGILFMVPGRLMALSVMKLFPR